uniref:Uncharacterized protein n=2 Tax=Caenorhabditis japonica TaxID=281687 RepID=A0A8R1HXB7_CAEJA
MTMRTIFALLLLVSATLAILGAANYDSSSKIASNATRIVRTSEFTVGPLEDDASEEDLETKREEVTVSEETHVEQPKRRVRRGSGGQQSQYGGGQQNGGGSKQGRGGMGKQGGYSGGQSGGNGNGNGNGGGRGQSQYGGGQGQGQQQQQNSQY